MAWREPTPHSAQVAAARSSAATALPLLDQVGDPEQDEDDGRAEQHASHEVVPHDDLHAAMGWSDLFSPMLIHLLPNQRYKLTEQ